MRVVCAMNLVAWLLFVGTAAQATDLHVRMDGGVDSVFGGSSTNPLKTISFAITLAAPGDTILVAGGLTAASEYNAANGESFPFTLDESKSGISIVGDEDPNDRDSWPRLGSDVSGALDAIFVIDARGADGNGDPNNSPTGISIRQMRFLEQDVAGVDAPAALLVDVDDGNSVGFAFEDNICERPWQNASTGSGRATVDIRVANGSLSTASTLARNEIECSDRGGVELVVTPSAVDEIAWTRLAIEDNYITNPGGASALFGLSWYAPDRGHPAPDTSSFQTPQFINGNTIRGRGLGLLHGIKIVCEENTFFGFMGMEQNTIEGCASHGFVMSGDGWVDSETPEIAIVFRQNRVIGNGGSGVYMEWDRTNPLVDLGYGYLHLNSDGGLFADNGRYAVEAVGIQQNSRGSLFLFNDTVANNQLGALRFDDEDHGGGPLLTSLALVGFSVTNSIVYLNNCAGGVCGDAIDGLDLNDPTLAAIVWGNVHYSDFQGVPLDDPASPCDWSLDSQGNMDCDPFFVNVQRGDYHLDDSPLSPCVDVNSPSLPPTLLDLDGDDRVQDGDFDCIGQPENWVDMGFDEVNQPNCGP